MNSNICHTIDKLNNILHKRQHSPVASISMNNISSSSNTVFNAKLDSGASRHFFKTEHAKFLTNVQPIKNGPIAHLPNNTTVQASHKATIKLHENISKMASEVLIFPNLQNESLISIGQLCDDDCIIIFTKEKFYVTKNGLCLYHGDRNKSDGLWDFDKTYSTINHKLNYIIAKNKTQMDLARYYHASLFSPSISTLNKAIKMAIYLHGLVYKILTSMH